MLQSKDIGWQIGSKKNKTQVSPARGRTWAPVVGVLRPGHWTTRKFLIPGNINWYGLSQKSPSQHQDLAPPNNLQAPVLDLSGQTTNKTGRQPLPLANRLPKVILSTQTPQNTTFDVALPTRGQDPAPPTRVQAPVPPTRKPTQALGPNSPTRGQTPEAKGAMALQPAERRPQTQ